MTHYTNKEYLNPQAILKYKDKEYTWLIKKAQEVFNRFIRQRDREGDYFTCISCGHTKRIEGGNYHAGHFYAVGHYHALRFNENNAHGQCIACNHFKSGNLLNYRDILIEKIGKSSFDDLTYRAAVSKRKTKKFTRFELIEIIERYKDITK